jgi:hypothetical protein
LLEKEADLWTFLLLCTGKCNLTSIHLPKKINAKLIFFSPKFNTQFTISNVAKEFLPMRNEVLLQGTSACAGHIGQSS